MFPQTQYEALLNFKGLPLVRTICTEKGQGFLVTDLPILEIPVSLQQDDALVSN